MDEIVHRNWNTVQWRYLSSLEICLGQCGMKTHRATGLLVIESIDQAGDLMCALAAHEDTGVSLLAYFLFSKPSDFFGE